MRARDIVGKTIRQVVQSRCSKDSGNDVIYHIDYIVFDDGSSMSFGVAELPGDYAVFGRFYPKKVKQSPEAEVTGAP